MPDAKREGVVTPAAWVGECKIALVGPGRQLEGPVLIHSGFDECVIQEGADVTPELGVPLGDRGLGIGGAHAVHLLDRERGVEEKARAGDDQDVGIVLPEVVAVLRV